ncbi:FAD-dependent oxidoreductase [Sphingomicrobium sp. XHP0239]|uniref:FAD-dependent oxidoreductase n=1 Tax=Sphingomicrobium maritimum TaxID=3133972 RepID=UPI0031CC4D19
MPTRAEPDYLIVGGGFYGCALALFLASVSDNVTLVEAGDTLLMRASRVNQARVHTGFHYPRSALTAVKSMMLHRRFMADFPDAVSEERPMLYAIARHRSKVSARRFERMFRELGAPIAPASIRDEALFNADMVEQVFECREATFDHRMLRERMAERLDASSVEVRLNTNVEAIKETATGVEVGLSGGETLRVGTLFNITYSGINHLLEKAGKRRAPLKHELAELAIVEVPPALVGLNVTLMDGPFFSCMSYPSMGLHSLTHVRYTPHMSWKDDGSVPSRDPYAVLDAAGLESRAPHMIRDAARYLPALADARHETSLYEVKTILTQNERDDGRPILYQRGPANSRIVSVLGGKIDNIYDLFDLVRQSDPALAGASEKLLVEARA